MKAKTLFGIAVAACGIGAHAADPHKHDEIKPKHGGLVKEVNDVQYEVVAKPGAIVVFVEDHGRKIETRGMTGKVSVRKGAERAEAPLAPAGENRLEARLNAQPAAGAVVIVQVTRPGKNEDTFRVTLK